MSGIFAVGVEVVSSVTLPIVLLHVVYEFTLQSHWLAITSVAVVRDPSHLTSLRQKCCTFPKEEEWGVCLQ